MAFRIPNEEVANTVTHAIGLALSIGGATVLMVRALATEDAWRITGCGIFAAALIAVYAASALSHGISSPQPRRWFRILDQGFIYLLIVGTYTPFSLVYLRTGWWWAFFGSMWVIALCGVVAKLLFVHRIDTATVWSYLMLGWMPAIPAAQLIGTLPTVALWWMLAGGLSYSLGTLFFIRDNPRFHCHAIWHVMVLVGSSCHFIAVFQFVATAPLAATL